MLLSTVDEAGSTHVGKTIRNTINDVIAQKYIAVHWKFKYQCVIFSFTHSQSHQPL